MVGIPRSFSPESRSSCEKLGITDLESTEDALSGADEWAAPEWRRPRSPSPKAQRDWQERKEWNRSRGRNRSSSSIISENSEVKAHNLEGFEPESNNHSSRRSSRSSHSSRSTRSAQFVSGCSSPLRSLSTDDEEEMIRAGAMLFRQRVLATTSGSVSVSSSEFSLDSPIFRSGSAREVGGSARMSGSTPTSRCASPVLRQSDWRKEWKQNTSIHRSMTSLPNDSMLEGAASGRDRPESFNLRRPSGPAFDAPLHLRPHSSPVPLQSDWRRASSISYRTLKSMEPEEERPESQHQPLAPQKPAHPHSQSPAATSEALKPKRAQPRHSGADSALSTQHSVSYATSLAITLLVLTPLTLLALMGWYLLILCPIMEDFAASNLFAWRG